MRRAWIALWLSLAAACVGFNIREPDACASICDTAANCGFLPSQLGWSDVSIAEAQADCERRCSNSPADDATVAAIVECFTAEGSSAQAWCPSEAPEDVDYRALWGSCAAISTCLQRRFRDDELRGDVSLTVQLLGWSDYQTHLGLALAAFPASTQGDVDVIESCQPALCSAELCGNLECQIDEGCVTSSSGAEEPTGGTDTGMTQEACSEVCELPDGEICDTRLCRVGHLTISSFCEDMGVQKITLKVYERERLPAIEVFLDVEADINPRCETATFRYDADSYELAPGPIKVLAAVEGSLTGAQLAEFGYFEDGETFEPDAATPYCLEFIGPTMTVGAGEAAVVLPLGERATLTGREGVLWRRCAVQ